MEMKRAGEVFVAGRYPQLTYNPRDQRKQEAELQRYLDDSGKALTVYGPSKSGKTVLLEHNLPEDEAIWVNGADLDSAEAFYRRIIDWLGIFDMLEVQTQTGSNAGGKLGVSLRIPGGSGITAEAGGGVSGSETTTQGRSRPLSEVALEGLKELPVPVIIDDFHYVPAAAKREIIRAVKALIKRTHVILIAVPQDAFDAVREETDMNGRVWNLQILRWEVPELVEIARAGFEVLGVVDHDDRVANQLAVASMGAPFLMQQLCLDYLYDEGIRHTQAPAVDLNESNDWEGFYAGVADRSVPGVFSLLASGPRTHGQKRSAQHLADGSGVTDIYGAVLYALAKLGPITQIGYTELTQKIGELIVDGPSSQRVTSALGHLSNIADENRGTSDAALEYKGDVLYILDPFLSFYLQRGSWALPTPPEK